MPKETLPQDAVPALVEPFLAGIRGKALDAAGLASHRQRLRALIGDIDRWAASREADPAKRRAIAERAREALIDGLTVETSGPVRRTEVETLVALAAEDDARARREGLERSLICWCPDEKWYRTLAGCPDNCAEEQKGLIREWLAAGYTDEEIIERMVAHPKGGPKVRGAPEARGANWIGYLAPLLLLAAAAGLLAWALRKVLRRRPRPPEKTEKTEEPGRTDADDVIGEGIERELKEMET